MKPAFVKAAAAFAAIVVTVVIFYLGMSISAWMTGPNLTQEGNLRNIIALAVAVLSGVAVYKSITRKWPSSN